MHTEVRLLCRTWYDSVEGAVFEGQRVALLALALLPSHKRTEVFNLRGLVHNTS